MTAPAWLKDKWLWGAAGVGGAAGLLVYLRRRSAGGQMTPEQAAASGQTIQPPAFSDAGVGAYQNLQNEFESLQSNLDTFASQLQDVQAGLAPSSPAQQAAANRTFSLQLHRIGRVGTTYNLRDIARRYAPNPASANSVEAELRRIVAANPALKGRTTLPGGFALKVPVLQ